MAANELGLPTGDNSGEAVHLRLDLEEDGFIEGQFSTNGSLRYFGTQLIVAEILFAICLMLIIAYTAPKYLGTGAAIILAIAAVTFPGVITIQLKRIRAQRITLTASSIVLVKPSFRPKAEEIKLQNISMIFNSDDPVQRCFGISEVHIITAYGQKHSVLGLKQPESFCTSVMQHKSSPRRGSLRNDELEMTLQEKADRHQHDTDIHGLQQLNNLEELSIPQLNALDKRLGRLDNHLTKLSDQLEEHKIRNNGEEENQEAKGISC
mmetsp:Transcript_43267/g.70373  ORF Transcript_43267/g.70373 Transcript_43267/m.70373 type:complete len:265 (-) Transcript_43267:416-1210(-)